MGVLFLSPFSRSQFHADNKSNFHSNFATKRIFFCRIRYRTGLELLSKNISIKQKKVAIIDLILVRRYFLLN